METGKLFSACFPCLRIAESWRHRFPSNPKPQANAMPDKTAPRRVVCEAAKSKVSSLCGIQGASWSQRMPLLLDRFCNDVRIDVYETPSQPWSTICTDVLQGHSGDTISKFSRERRVNLLVLGTTSHHHSVLLLIGVTAEPICQNAECSVLARKSIEFRPTALPCGQRSGACLGCA